MDRSTFGRARRPMFAVVAPRLGRGPTVRQQFVLGSLDFFALGLASLSIGRPLAMIGFFDFVAWFGHITFPSMFEVTGRFAGVKIISA